MSYKQILCVLVGLSCAFGCKETISSKNIRTQGISMNVVVTALSDDRSEVSVTLRAGGDESNTYVDLNDGDHVFALADGERKQMSQVSEGELEASFDVGAEDTLFEIHFMREDFDDATDNQGTLPAPFEITSEHDDPISRADDVTISWEPGADDSMHLEIDDQDESCIYSYDSAVEDSADDAESTFVVPGGTFDPTNDDDMETCELQIELTRSRRAGPRTDSSGSIFTDPVLDPESRFRLEQVRTTSFTSTP